MAKETVIPLWSISEKSEVNLPQCHFIVILIQFWGVVIGGTLKEYGVKEIIPRLIRFLCFAVPPVVRAGFSDMQFGKQELSCWRS